MNSKRWIAVGVAVGLLVMSSISNVIVKQLNFGGETTKQIDSFRSIFQSQEEMTEEILEPGDAGKRIAVLRVEGVITASTSTGLFTTTGYDHNFFLKQIDRIKQDLTVAGVLLVVNTPGGGTFESAQIKDRLRSLQSENKLPIYVTMQSMAASGGYYISAYSDKIFATEETLTGSIGVIMSGTNLAGLYDKLGVEDNTIKSGEFKDIGSSSRPMTPEDREILQNMINLSYERFLTVVSEGRKIEREKARALADGRIYDGSQAKEIGLVDEIGYYEDALMSLKEDNELLEAEVFSYNTGLGSWAQFLSSKFKGVSMDNNAGLEKLNILIQQFSTEGMRPMYMYQGGLYE